MALNWNWKEKCGEAILTQSVDGEEKEFILHLYQGNAYLIFISEWIEDGNEMYNVWSFWADKDHAKNCLGIGKQKDCYNIYAEGWQTITKFRLNKAKMNHFADIVSMISKAFDNIDIEIYTEKGTA